MLTNLHVKNLALIEEADIYFNNGLNILTGETGAGKSIILGSINIAIGNKVSADIIRKGCDYALTELMFHTDNQEVIKTLRSMDIEELDDGDVLISRKIMPTRSVIKINGQNCTATQARVVAAYLIDIHGQHDNQILLNEGKHLAVVDNFGKDSILPVKNELKREYGIYSGILKELKEVDIDADTRSREISFMEYEVNEIESACLKDGEDEELEAEFKKMANAQKIMESIESAVSYFDDGNENITMMTGMAARDINGVTQYDERLVKIADTLADLESMASDASRMLSDYIEQCEFDEEDYTRVRERLDLINSLKMKYGRTIKDISEYLEDKKSKLEKLYDHDNLIKTLSQKAETQRIIVDNICTQLTNERKKAAKELEIQIIDALKDLNFLDVRFEAEFSKTDDYSANGNDFMHFIISTNPGEDLKPLSRIASGGELSRIMLAIKTVTANQDNIGTLIFDEIDAGISGRTAQMVANKLSELSQVHQIICITHLPQIASMADSHFMIEKTSTNNSTTTDIYQLKEEESDKELARLLGGSELTKAALDNARELKEKARVFKNYKK